MRKRWQLFRAADFRSLMCPCFTFCRILGTFPYKIDNSIFEISKPHYVVSIIITCILCVSELIIFYYYNKITNFKDVIIFFSFNCYGILSSFIAIVTLVLSSPRMRLLQTVMKISSQLPSESYQKLSRLIYFKDIFGFLYLVGLVFTDFIIMDMDIFLLIYTMYTVLLIFQMDMLYMNCVCILKACLKEINNYLIRMRKFMLNNEPNIPTMFYYDQKYPFLIMNLKTLRKQQLMISNTIQRLNMIFSLQLVATVVISFIDIIFVLYFHVVKWDNGLLINWFESPNMFLTSVVNHIIRILLLVWACETSKNEVQEMRTIIHEVLNSTRNGQIKNELQLFSLQTLHCKSTFFAKAFTMDATLLTMMTSVLTTYTLILLQFLIISRTC